jgi:protein-disulfide isomerase
MPSGKQARRARHVPPPEPQVPRPPRPVQPAPAARRASPKVLAGVAAAVVAALLAGVLVAVFAGGSSSTANVPAVGRLAGGLPGSAVVWKLFEGIPQSGAVLGEASAPATLVEYVDLQCPYCREFETTVLPQLVAEDVRPGKLRIEMRTLAFIGPDSVRGRNAALASGSQNRQFDLAELLYFNQGVENAGWLSRQLVESAAASVPGMRVPAMLDAMSSASVRAKGAALDADAKASSVTSTPTILVGKTGATPARVSMSSPDDFAAVQAAIDRALA